MRRRRNSRSRQRKTRRRRNSRSRQRKTRRRNLRESVDMRQKIKSLEDFLEKLEEGDHILRHTRRQFMSNRDVPEEFKEKLEQLNSKRGDFLNRLLDEILEMKRLYT